MFLLLVLATTTAVRHPTKTFVVCDEQARDETKNILSEIFEIIPWRTDMRLYPSRRNKRLCRGETPHPNEIIMDPLLGTAAHSELTFISGKIDSAIIRINPSCVQSHETLRVLLLHEIGHVYGMVHGDSDGLNWLEPADTIMNYVLIRENSGRCLQEVNMLDYTTFDVLQLREPEDTLDQSEFISDAASFATTSLKDQRLIRPVCY